MTLFQLALREILQRRVNFLLGVLSVGVAITVLSGSLLLLKTYDQRTEEILAGKQMELGNRIERLRVDTVQAMEHLGFNLTILPAEQNLGDWYADNYSARTMPQVYAEKLSASQLVTIDHLEPVLRQKVRWPETQWTLLISGVSSSNAPAAGQVDVGDEIARSLALNPGDTLQLMGRTFTVRNRMAQEAAVEDITLTLSLSEAQTLLGAEGKISEIRARQCRVAWQDMGRIREEVSRILPGTQVIEKGSEVLTKVTAIRQVEEKGAAQIRNEKVAREQMRQSLRKTLGVLLPIILLVCIAWIYLLTADNTARRNVEIGTLRTLGFSSIDILSLFLFRTLITGLLGGSAGLSLCAIFAHGLPLQWVFWLLLFSLFLTLAGSILPCRQAVTRDPAEILRGES